MTKHELVDKVLEFWTEDKYCQYHLALRDDPYHIHPNSQEVTHVSDPDATKWCALGVIGKFAWEVDPYSLSEQVAVDFKDKYNKFLEDSNDLDGYYVTIKRLKELYDGNV